MVREADPDDARATLIGLSPAGRRVLQRVLDAQRRWLGEFLDGWDERDLTVFASMLRRFATTLEGSARNDCATVAAK